MPSSLCQARTHAAVRVRGEVRKMDLPVFRPRRSRNFQGVKKARLVESGASVLPHELEEQGRDMGFRKGLEKAGSRGRCET